MINNPSCRILSLTVCISVAGALLGCQAETTEMAAVSTAKVTGTVSLDGNLIADAKIAFVPERLMDASNQPQPLAFGLTNDAGQYELKLADGTAQIPSGSYRVIVSKRGDSGTVENSAWPQGSPQFGNLGFNQPQVKPTAEPSVESPDFEQLREKIGRYELLPTHYNIDSTLTVELEPGKSEIQENLELSTIDPLLTGN